MQFPELAVRERVHRVDDNCLYFTSTSVPQHMVHYGNDIERYRPKLLPDQVPVVRT